MSGLSGLQRLSLQGGNPGLRGKRQRKYVYPQCGKVKIRPDSDGRVSGKQGNRHDVDVVRSYRILAGVLRASGGN